MLDFRAEILGYSSFAGEAALHLIGNELPLFRFIKTLAVVRSPHRGGQMTVWQDQTFAILLACSGGFQSWCDVHSPAKLAL